MDPEKVRPSNFKDFTVVFEDDHFAVAFGVDDEKKRRMAMRWKGSGDNVGHPKRGKHPLWFLLPEYDNWNSEIMRTVENVKLHKERNKKK
jgi:hypothetical protein